MDLDEFTRGLRFVMLIGAARADAKDERLAALRYLHESLDVLVQAGLWDEAEQLVRSVMPKGWEPGSEWQVRD